MPKSKRTPLSRELIIKQLEVLQNSRKPESAAKKLGLNYATYLARFRRAGMSVKEAHYLLKKGEKPEKIAHKLFPEKPVLTEAKMEQKLVDDIVELIHTVVRKELRAA